MPENAYARLIAGAKLPLALVVIVLVLLLAVLRTCREIEEVRRAPGVVERAAEAVGGIAERFRSGRITTTFQAAIPQLQPGGPLLELAAYEATETITRTDERSVMFDLVPLGTTVSEIRVPVTYRYHVRLDAPWRLDVRDTTCIVYAPVLRPTLPPAIHTDRMEKRSQSGWLRFDERERMAELERGLTPTLSQRAADRGHMQMVRETARRRIAEFVRSWLLREGQWADGKFGAVTVVFPGEDQHALPAPTLSEPRD